MFKKRLTSFLCLAFAVLMLLSLAACGNNDDTSTPDESTVSTTAEATTTQSTTTKPATTAPASTTAATSSTAKEDGDSANSEDVPVVQNPDGQEIIGAGSKSQPYLEMPSSDMTVTTVKVPAGKELYYDIYRVGGKYLEIYDADAYVIYEGYRYDAYDGVVSLMVGSALASDTVSFQIGNNSSSAKSFTLYFYDLYGTFENPEIIDSFKNPEWIQTSLYAGNDKGYTYSYTAEKNGTLRFYVDNPLEEFIFTATRYVYSDGMEIPMQRTFDEVKSDSNGNYIEMEVLKGEELMIAISSYPMGSYYPAAEVLWYGTYI